MKKIFKIFTLISMVVILGLGTSFSVMSENSSVLDTEPTYKPQSFTIPIRGTDTSFVFDNANILSPETENNIIERNEQLEEFETEIFVITVSSLIEDESIESLSKKIFTSLEIGGDTQKGALLLVNIDTSTDLVPMYYILLGNGLTEFKGENFQNTVKFQLENKFKSEKYNDFSDEFVKIITEKVTGEESVVDSEKITKEENNAFMDGVGVVFEILKILFIVVLIAVIIAILVIFMLNKSSNKKRRKRAVRRPASSTSQKSAPQKRATTQKRSTTQKRATAKKTTTTTKKSTPSSAKRTTKAPQKRTSQTSTKRPTSKKPVKK